MSTVYVMSRLIATDLFELIFEIDDEFLEMKIYTRCAEMQA